MVRLTDSTIAHIGDLIVMIGLELDIPLDQMARVGKACQQQAEKRIRDWDEQGILPTPNAEPLS